MFSCLSFNLYKEATLLDVVCGAGKVAFLSGFSIAN